MTKQHMPEVWKRELGDLFAAAQGREQIETLIDGLFTPQEIEGAAFRWRLMQRLLRGDTQRVIGKELGISLGKIARGSRLLQYGPPEFRELAERLAGEHGAAKSADAPSTNPEPSPGKVGAP